MRIGGLGLFNRTNSRSLFNIASWHNPRSLTWRWILSVYFRTPTLTPHFYVYGGSGPRWSRKHGFGTLFSGWNWGASLGLGTLIHFRIDYRSVALSLLGAEFGFVTQRPMWLVDIERRRTERQSAV